MSKLELHLFHLLDFMGRLKIPQNGLHQFIKVSIYEKQPLPPRGKMAAIFCKPIKHLVICVVFCFSFVVAAAL